jgi:glyoxylase-like metal-dependent hydrolase (beta-lactamase superfamily II)
LVPGGAFDFQQGNASAWVKISGARILLDCGHSIYRSLRERGLASQIDYFLITHLHDDHVGSLSSTILHQKHLVTPPRKAKILIPPGDNGKKLQENLNSFLSFSLHQPTRYLDFVPLSEVPGIRAIDTTGFHVPGMVSFGYAFEDEKERIVYSGDLGEPQVIFDFLEENPSECPTRIFHEMSYWDTQGVHTYYKKLEEKLSNWSIFGYHCNPAQAPADLKVPLVAQQPSLLLSRN